MKLLTVAPRRVCPLSQFATAGVANDHTLSSFKQHRLAVLHSGGQESTAGPGAVLLLEAPGRGEAGSRPCAASGGHPPSWAHGPTSLQPVPHWTHPLSDADPPRPL